MKKYIFIIGCIFLAGESYAKDYEERAQVLLGAKNIGELNQKLKEMDAHDDLIHSCKWELSSQLVPRSCYLLPLTDEQRLAADESCKRAVKNLKREAPLEDLSQKCRNYVSQKNMDLRYRLKEENPAEYILKK